MSIIEKLFCLFAIGITCVNAYLLKSRSKRAIAGNPELKEGYGKLFGGYLIYLNVPWIVMGSGILVGGVPGVFDYFYPRAGNPFVLAYHASIVVLLVLGVYWIYFRGGAEFLVKHPGVINMDMKSAWAFKLLFAVMLLGAVFGMAMMWLSDLPDPRFEIIAAQQLIRPDGQF